MRSLRGLLVLGLLLIPAVALAITIDNLNQNNASGVPTLNATSVTVNGTVISPDSIFSPTATDIHIQDATGATDVFLTGGTATYHFGFGDSVQVTGTVTQFNGLTEIGLAGGSVTHLGTATVIPQPLVLTCTQALNSYVFAFNTEPNQSRLIRINGVHIASGTWPTTVSGSNSSINISDGTATLLLFIDKDSPVNGSPSPSSVFDIIGVLRQFDSTSPYTTGYELVPRFVSDVVSAPGPTFTQFPTVTALDSLSATIAWSTTGPTSSTLHYGTTTSYGTDITDGVVSTSHSVTILGLTPRTVYHMKADATDVNGTSSTFDRVFITWPSPGTPGDITVYFNRPVENAVARDGYPLAQGSVACDQKLVDLINGTSVSCDCALYSFSLQNVVNALIAAKNRGVAVRLILDQSNSQAYASQLVSAGIPVINSGYGGNHADGSIMHSKYVILDGKAAIKDSAKVWTGSWNCSASGQDDAQNVIILRDWGLAQAYTLDFDQMWGSSTATPNSANAKMGSKKSEVAPHRFLIGGRRVDAFFSPSDGTEGYLIKNIQEAQHSELFALLTFTSDPLSAAMKAHRDSLTEPVFKVRGLFENTQVDASSEWCKLDGQVSCSNYWSPRADVFEDFSTAYDLLHHKYVILDEGYSNAAIWTGSHNWSNAANTVNDENSVIVRDPILANVYYQEWYRRYVDAGGQLAGVGPSQSGGPEVELSQSRPNPSHGDTRIGYTLPADDGRVSLGVFDLSGRLVKQLVSGSLSAGSHEARWDGRDASGAPAPAGLYFYRLRTSLGSTTRRLVLAR
jgi:phosphatidylserine/phosphatidylglycerophosphate/cardiolipin synthase-like enzyme